jgi:voltage-gated potassium channel
VAGLFRHRFKLLLAVLLVFILGMPVVFEMLAEMSPAGGQPLAWGGGALVLLAATLVVSGKQRIRLVAYGLVIPSLAIEVGAVFVWPDELLVVHFLVRIVFLGFIIVEMLRQLFAQEEISFDTVCSSLCIYLLLGLTWENVYAIMEIVAPGSLITVTRTPADVAGPNIAVASAGLFRMRYFSFATLTSVGYGDIVPGSTLARMCAITEALVAQIYLVVMVSRLVGMHVSQTMPAPTSPNRVDSGPREE